MRLPPLCVLAAEQWVTGGREKGKRLGVSETGSILERPVSEWRELCNQARQSG